MSLKKFTHLRSFLTTGFPDTDSDSDTQTVQSFVASNSKEQAESVLQQSQAFLETGEFNLEDLGIDTNRWFEDADQAKGWVQGLMQSLEENLGTQQSGGASIIVKDCNGIVLTEEDSVQVIKDLKVKGGSSDLKRGTLIKKIHFVNDPEVVECRVNGSTLVLKTCFLKKV